MPNSVMFLLLTSQQSGRLHLSLNSMALEGSYQVSVGWGVEVLEKVCCKISFLLVQVTKIKINDTK